jgi:hypothetical protein
MTVIGSGAVAGLAIGCANVVSVLRNLERGPMQLWQSGDETCDNAGLANVARVSADDDDCHLLSGLFAARETRQGREFT